MNKCSIVIPTKDKLSRLFLTLKCLEPQIKEGIEVIIVFDGCSQETIDGYHKLHWSFTPVDVISPQNIGRAAARNLGLSYATGEIIIFLDDDRLTESDFIEKHLSHHTSEPCVVLGERMDLKSTESEITQLMTDQDISSTLQKVKQGCHKEFYYNIKKIFLKNPYNPLRYIGFITGNVSIDAALLHEINGFDETFRGWGYEDTDLGYRLALNGVKYISDYDIVCYHMLHAHVRGQKSKEELANLKYFKQKFPADKSLQRALSLYTLKASLKL